MKTALLRRTAMGDTGTFGVLEVDGERFVTGELPWRDNIRGRSCVPAGTYDVVWAPSGRYGHKYELQGVPGRSDILIHNGNFCGDRDKGLAAQVDGCILLGRTREIVRDEKHGIAQDGVTASMATVDHFETLLGRAPFKLTIVDEYAETGDPAGNVG